MTYNHAAHQRERIRALEQHVRGLEQTRDQLVRVLALTVRVAAGNDCDPYLLMFLIEAYDRQQQEHRATIDDLLAETDRFLELLRTFPATEAAA